MADPPIGYLRVHVRVEARGVARVEQAYIINYVAIGRLESFMHRPSYTSIAILHL
jgi:hypothetical protein